MRVPVVCWVGIITFREETCAAIAQVLAQEPSVAEIIVALDQLYSIALAQGQLIAASSSEVVDDEQGGADGRILFGTASCGRHSEVRMGRCVVAEDTRGWKGGGVAVGDVDRE